jgi:aminoglycoside 3-N-acetyltransferase
MLMSRTRESDALLPLLERMRVPSDGVLIVHSAIATLSRRGFRAEAMIETFLDYMSNGTVVMPTMSWRTVTPDHPHWDEIETRSETGILSEIFRTRYASHRSIHPTHSVAVHGIKADVLVARHHLDHTPVSPNSPYGLMKPDQAFVLMIGVGLETCTAIHLPEETIAPDVYLRPIDPAELYQCRARTGRIHEVRTRRHWRLDRDFPQFAAPLERDGLLQSGSLEGCGYTIVGLGDLLNAVVAALSDNPRATLRVPAI